MDGQKQAVTRRTWDDARFESVVGALGKVKVPKVKKPKTEEEPVKMAKQSWDNKQLGAQIGQMLSDIKNKGTGAALAGGGAALGLSALGAGAGMAPTGALLGSAYGAGQAPDGEKTRGAVQGILPGAGAGFGLGAGAMGGTGVGAMLGALLASKLKANPTLALASIAGGGGMGGVLGGITGLQAGKGLGKAIQKPILGEPVDRAKTAGCGSKKKKKSKKGK